MRRCHFPQIRSHRPASSWQAGRHRHRRTACCSDLTVDGQVITSLGAWRKLLQTLHANNVAMVQPQEVPWCQDKGMTLLDVRTEKQYVKGFIYGAVNIPLYQPIAKWDALSIARRAGFALFGVLNGTEPNPDFLADVEECVDKQDGVVVCCALGGDLEPHEQASQSVQSRSMIAAYELINAGYTNVSILAGGVNNWQETGRDLYVEDSEASDDQDSQQQGPGTDAAVH